MKIYKIDNSKINEYTKRTNSRVFKILVIAMVTTFFFMFTMTMQDDAPSNLFNLVLFSMLFTGIIVTLIYLNNKKLGRLTAESLQITVDDNSIIREINLENEPRLNFLHRIAYNKAKNVSDGYYSKIDFDNIKSIEEKNGDLWIKSKTSNTFNGKGIIVVPLELKNFEDLKREINVRQNNNYCL